MILLTNSSLHPLVSIIVRFISCQPILVGYRIVVFQRKEEEESSNNSTIEKNKRLQESIAKWQLINSTQSSIRVIDIPTLTEVSSSAVRRSTDEKALKIMLSSEVLEYIQDKQMYALSDSK